MKICARWYFDFRNSSQYYMRVYFLFFDKVNVNHNVLSPFTKHKIWCIYNKQVPCDQFHRILFLVAVVWTKLDHKLLLPLLDILIFTRSSNHFPFLLLHDTIFLPTEIEYSNVEGLLQCDPSQLVFVYQNICSWKWSSKSNPLPDMTLYVAKYEQLLPRLSQGQVINLLTKRTSKEMQILVTVW